ncbi:MULTISPECIES: reprolysin-like metallopeptidase [unclassified Blastococcus]
MSPRLPLTGRRPRLLRATLVAAAAALVPVALPAAASAEGPAAETVVGELVQAWPEDVLAGEDAAGHDHAGDEHTGAEHTGAGHPEQPLSWVETAAGDAVRVPTEDVAGLPVGSTVELTLGAAVDDEAGVAHELDPAREVLAGEVRDSAPAAAGTPSNAVTVVRVVPAGGRPDGTSVASLVAAVDGPVAGFWAGQTGGAVRFGVTAAAPDWVYATASCADPTALWAEAAAAAGFTAGPGRHLLVYVSSLPADLPGCAVALGQVGTGPGAGGRAYVRAVLPTLIAHELGHNLGLGHSSARQCDAAVETGSCRTAGYRDYYDVMGASWERVGSLNAAQADRLGVLPAGARQVLAVGDPDTTVTLAPLGGSAGTRALRLDAADGGTYWLEYRAAAGVDAWLASANRFRLDTGVLLRRAGDATDSSLLLDGTPSAAGRWDDDLQAALPLGVPVPVGGGFTVTVQATGAVGATVLVQPAARPVPAPPAGTDPGAAPDVLPGAAAAAPAAGSDAPAAPPGEAGTPAEPAPVAAQAAAADEQTTLAPRARTTSTLWLLPLLTGLGVTGTVLAGWRALARRRAVAR